MDNNLRIDDKFTIYYTNSDQLTKTKLNELFLLSKLYQPDIICITEVLPKNSIITPSDPMYAIDGYKIICSRLQGRGILMYSKPHIQVQVLANIVVFEEYLLCNIICDKEKLLLCVVYRSPNSTVQNDIFLCDLLSHVCTIKTDQLLIVGDFNYSSINWSLCDSSIKSPNVLLFLNKLRDLFLDQLVTEPTRIRHGQQQNILDLILTDNRHFIYDIIYSSQLGCSDHISLYIKLNFSLDLPCIKRQLFYKAKFGDIADYLESIDWDSLFLDKCIQVCFNLFYDHMLFAIDKFIPVCDTPPRESTDKAWMNRELKQAIKEKRTTFNTYFRSKTVENDNLAIRARNIANNMNDKCRTEYEDKIINNCKINPKSFWSYVKKRTKKTGDISALEDTDKKLVTNDYDNANLLNVYFSSVFVNEPIDNFFDNNKIELTDVILDRIVVTETEVFTVIDKLGMSKAPGPDGIHACVLKNCNSIISKILTYLFNRSLIEGKLPSQWKDANVKALFKKGKRTVCSNYRPVSLTSIICKLLESIIRDKLVCFLETNGIITNAQHGFRPGHSCSSQLIELMEDFTDFFEHSDPFDTIYLDFAKAFDRVPHVRLLTKVYNYGVRGDLFDWIKDFLYNRRQRVVINNSYSDWSMVSSGIPQGSVLGPILFLVFINDLPGDIISKIKIFADDTKIYNSCRNHMLLQSDLDRLVRWSQYWLLPFNIDKCCVIHYGKYNPCINYSMDSSHLNSVDNIKDLGVLFSSNLSFEAHIHKITASANSRIGLIKNTFHCIRPQGFLHLYKSLIRPILEYCSTTWCPHLRKHELELETIQRRATKIVPTIANLSYSERLVSLRLDTLYFRRRRADLLLVYRILNDLDSLDSDIFFEISTSVTRGNNKKLIKPRASTSTKQYSFSHRVINDWNSLPNEVIMVNSVNMFKSRLSKFWSDIDFRYNFVFYH